MKHYCNPLNENSTLNMENHFTDVNKMVEETPGGSVLDKNPSTGKLENRFELARRRCSEVIDLDQEPPVRYTTVKCKTVLKELNDLEKLVKLEIQLERKKVISYVNLLLSDGQEFILDYDKLLLFDSKNLKSKYKL